MKNDLFHLYNALHETLDLLTDDTDTDGEPVDKEVMARRIARAGAVCGVAQQIIGVGRLALDAARLPPGLLRLCHDRHDGQDA